MIYQPILGGAVNYVASVSVLKEYPLHIHHEIEMLYCLSGRFGSVINGKEYPVEAGQMVVAASMAPHEIRSPEHCRALLLEIGPLFLHENFSHLCQLGFDGMLFDLRPDQPLSENAQEMRGLLTELAEICREKDEISDLKVIGDLYRMTALLLSDGKQRPDRKNREQKTPEIQKALELVYYHYREDIRVEDAARVTNYGKSNFCKIFKNSVGMTFHAYLNLYRVRCAECLLSATEKSMDEIALMAGFSDQKNFSRVFKSVIGQTPTAYRRAFAGEKREADPA